jgi:hypothetical protein
LFGLFLINVLPLLFVDDEENDIEEDLLFRFFVLLTLDICCSNNLFVFRAFNKLFIINVLSVIKSVNGQNEYLNESNHVKYFKNND